MGSEITNNSEKADRRRLLKLISEKNEIKLGTTGIRKALEVAGNPENKYPIIMVGGTNGKTTTSYFISQFLAYSGLEVGLFTSPNPNSILEGIKHLLYKKNDGNVRDKTNKGKIGKLVISNIWENHLFEYLKLAESTGIELTSFEMQVFSACNQFSRWGVDAAVMEMGMGGKGDAVNFRKPELAVITNVSFDHTFFLGNSVRKIARNKSHIIPEKGVVVTGAKPPALNYIREFAEKRNASVVIPDYNRISHFPGFPGYYMKENALLALTTVLQLQDNVKNGFSPQIKKNDLFELAEELIPPEGRFQVFELKNGSKIILDGAHNPDGFLELLNEVENFKKKFNIVEITALIGILDSKDIQGMLRFTSNLCWRFFITKPALQRGASPQKIASELREYHDNIKIFNSVEKAVKTGISEMEDESDLLVITGSLYTVYEALDFLRRFDIND